jgi:DNA primase
MEFYQNFVSFVKQEDKQIYALCPFHKEKVPSFTINTDTGQWYCHGCGEGGGYVTFLQKFLGLVKQDAMDIVNG